MPGLGLSLPGLVARGWRWLWCTARGDSSELDMAVSALCNAGLRGWHLFFEGEGCFPGMGLGGTDPSLVVCWIRACNRAGERLSKELGWFVSRSRALQVMLCQHGRGGGGLAMKRYP